MIKRNTKRYTAGHRIAMLITAIPPLLVFALAAVVLFGGFIFNLSFTWTFVFLPLMVLFLCYKTVFSEMSVGGKICSIIGVYFVAVPVFMFSLLAGKYEMQWVNRDQELTEFSVMSIEENPFLPSLESVGNPVEQQYIEYESIQAVFFDIHVDALICRYTPEEYALQKQLVDEQSAFRTEPYTYGEYVCEPAVSIDGYHFRMIDSPDVAYPHRLGFVAENDETCEIVWISFVDDDLDYIAALKKFLLDDCGWEHMR